MFTAKQSSISSEKSVSAELTINYGSRRIREIYSIPSGTDALAMLKLKHDVSGREYAGIGFFITGIDGTNQDKGHSWLFFVDGKPASSSAGNTIIKEDTQIEFRFLPNDETMKYFGNK